MPGAFNATIYVPIPNRRKERIERKQTKEEVQPAVYDDEMKPFPLGSHLIH